MKLPFAHREESRAATKAASSVVALRRERYAAIGQRFSPSKVLLILSGAPWIWGLIRDGGSASRHIHRSFQQYNWRRYGILGRALVYVGFVAGVPIVLGMMAILTAINGARVWREEKKGPIRQVWEQLVLWLSKGVLPVSYYIFELYQGDKRGAALEYLYRLETKRGIYALLRERFSSAETTEALRNNAEFALRCKARGAAAVPVLFTIDKGRMTRFDAEVPGLPHCDLFLKPLSGSGGRGASVWRYLANGSYRNAAAGDLKESELVCHLAEISEKEPFVGRLLVSNHPELAELSQDALSSIRVLTCLDERGRPEITHAALRMARRPGIVVDNFHAGGIAARVELGTGMVGAATDRGTTRGTRWWEKHPSSGAQILGRRIPMWNEVARLVRNAHAAFSDQVIVGWDVAVLEYGPRLIAGTDTPDLDIIQRTHRGPIGNSRFGVLLAHHLNRTLPNQRSPVHGSAHDASR